MKKRCIKPVERPRHTWRPLVRADSRNHDPFLVYSMAAFNFDGGWRQLLVKCHAQNKWPQTQPSFSSTAFG